MHVDGAETNVTETNVRPCRYCRAAYGDDAELCEFAHGHSVEEVGTLAAAMARIFQQRNPTDEQIGWFMDDAEAVIEDFDPVPDKWRLRKLPMSVDDEFIVRFRVNDVTYVIENGEGHIPPVRLTTLRTWRKEAEANHG